MHVLHPLSRPLTALLALAAAAAPARGASGPAQPAAAAARPRAPAPIPVAILPLRALGGLPPSAQALEETLRNEVAALPEVRLVSPPAVAAALRREPDCLDRLACAAAAAQRAGARQFIAGTVSSLGDAVTLDLKLIEARSGRELRRATHPFSGKEEELIELLRATAAELLAPQRYAGSLWVVLEGATADDARGARLFLDGEPRGTLPLAAPLAGIAPGRHALRVAREGFVDAVTFVEIQFARTTEARIDLGRGAPQVRAASTAPAGALAASDTSGTQRGPLLKIAGWSGVGLGAVALVAAITVHAKAYAVASDLNRREAANQLTVADLPSYAQIGRETRAARALYATGGVLAAAGVGALLWDRHLDQKALHLEAAPATGGAALGVGGRF